MSIILNKNMRLRQTDHLDGRVEKQGKSLWHKDYAVFSYWHNILRIVECAQNDNHSHSIECKGEKMSISSAINRFLKDETGVTAIEYGILAAAMAAAVGYIFSSDGAFISALRDKFGQIANDISGAGKNVSIK